MCHLFGQQTRKTYFTLQFSGKSIIGNVSQQAVNRKSGNRNRVRDRDRVRALMDKRGHSLTV